MKWLTNCLNLKLYKFYDKARRLLSKSGLFSLPISRGRWLRMTAIGKRSCMFRNVQLFGFLVRSFLVVTWHLLSEVYILGAHDTFIVKKYVR